MLTRLVLSISLASLVSISAFADQSFKAVSSSDLDTLTKEFSSNFSHASVMGAATLGKIFGFEFGLVAGQNPSPGLDKIVKASDPTQSLPNLYHAGLLLAVSVPLGFTGEVVYTPKVGSNGLEYTGNSIALKYTLDESLIVLPFNLAFRYFVSNSKLSFPQTTATATGTVENKNSVTGLQLLVSPSLPMVEPYAGVGMLQAKDTLSFNGTGTIFGVGYPGSSSQDATANTTQLLLGVNVHVLLFSIGAEYAKSFDSDRYTGKLAFVF